MVYATCIIDEVLQFKIDPEYVISKFSDIDQNVTIIFVCMKGNQRKDDTWKHKGQTYYAINLPYDQVKALDDARPLLLEAVAKRLGIPVPAIEETAAA